MYQRRQKNVKKLQQEKIHPARPLSLPLRLFAFVEMVWMIENREMGWEDASVDPLGNVAGR